LTKTYHCTICKEEIKGKKNWQKHKTFELLMRMPEQDIINMVDLSLQGISGYDAPFSGAGTVLDPEKDRYRVIIPKD
jgi:hypothetical protein